jgi:hypothetical protein
MMVDGEDGRVTIARDRLLAFLNGLQLVGLGGDQAQNPCFQSLYETEYARSISVPSRLIMSASESSSRVSMPKFLAQLQRAFHTVVQYSLPWKKISPLLARELTQDAKNPPWWGVVIKGSK